MLEAWGQIWVKNNESIEVGLGEPRAFFKGFQEVCRKMINGLISHLNLLEEVLY